MIHTDMLYRITLNYIKKERYTGSYKGTRYMLEKKEFKQEEGSDEPKKDPVILSCAWPEPFAFDKTEESLKIYKEFPLTDDGLTDAIAWISQMQETISSN